MTPKAPSFFRITGALARGILLVAVFLLVAALWVSALLTTVEVRITDARLEDLFFENDNLLLSLLGLAVGGVGLLGLWFVSARIPRRWLGWILFCAVLVSGTIWVICARSAPTHDSYQVTFAGEQMSKGNAAPLGTNYFRYYPFQLGYVAWTELWSYLLVPYNHYQPLQIVNVICLAAAAAALYGIVRLLFRGERAARLFFLLFLLFPQAIWFCTFLYGNLPSFCFAALAVFLMLCYLRTGRVLQISLSALCILISIWLKLNSLIVFVAMAIVFLLHIWQEGRWRLIPLLLAFVLVVPLAKDLPIAFYEARTEHDFGKGIPMSAWASMGLHYASGDRPGWFNGNITTGVFDQYGQDYDKAHEHSMYHIRKRIDYFSDHPRDAIDFFGTKILSQWNEPTFQSIWNNQVRGNYGARIGIAKTVCDEMPDVFIALCDIGHAVNLLGMAVGLVALLKRRRAEDILLPLIFFGGFLYHTVFEAKSQYVLVYLLWMLPVAAYGWSLIALPIGRWTSAYVEKWKQIIRTDRI